jgi:predicted metal-dependent phosphoesterase TrpH
MVEVDLHLHTTLSDGTLKPSQVVDLCAERGLKIIAISDHDSTEGLAEAFETAKRYPQLTIVPAIELSTDIPGSEIHVLGYFVDYNDASFQQVLKGFREGRTDRGRLMVQKLNDLGLNISWERVEELSDGGAVGRPHVAQALVEAGYIEYPREAFDRYIGREGPAYVGRPRLTPVEAVKLLTDNGALPVMAHPTYHKSEPGITHTDALRSTLLELKEAGLVGMEVHYGDYTEEEVARLLKLADELELVPCGGSDYHASGNPDEPEPGSVGPPMASIEALESIRRQRAATS